MTPAEHYAAAERWLRIADQHVDSAPLGDVVRTPVAVDTFDRFVARAQVHATLATINADALWPLRTVEATPAEPAEPHARQRAAVNWPPCEACDHPASRHDLTSDIPPNGGWNDLIEPCQVEDCGCLGYLGEDN